MNLSSDDESASDDDRDWKRSNKTRTAEAKSPLNQLKLDSDTASSLDFEIDGTNELDNSSNEKAEQKEVKVLTSYVSTNSKYSNANKNHQQNYNQTNYIKPSTTLRYNKSVLPTNSYQNTNDFSKTQVSNIDISKPPPTMSSYNTDTASYNYSNKDLYTSKSFYSTQSAPYNIQNYSNTAYNSNTTSYLSIPPPPTDYTKIPPPSFFSVPPPSAPSINLSVPPPTSFNPLLPPPLKTQVPDMSKPPPSNLISISKASTSSSGPRKVDKYDISKRSRSNSRSRSRSPYRSSDRKKARSPKYSHHRYDRRSRHKSRYHDDEYEETLQTLREVHERECEKYRRNPKEHPRYIEETNKFVENFCRIQRENGKDYSSVDALKEWDEVWNVKLEILLKKAWDKKKDLCLSLLEEKESNRKYKQRRNKSHSRSRSRSRSKSPGHRYKYSRSRSRSRSRDRKKYRSRSKERRYTRSRSRSRSQGRNKRVRRRYSKSGSSSPGYINSESSSSTNDRIRGERHRSKSNEKDVSFDITDERNFGNSSSYNKKKYDPMNEDNSREDTAASHYISDSQSMPYKQDLDILENASKILYRLLEVPSVLGFLKEPISLLNTKCLEAIYRQDDFLKVFDENEVMVLRMVKDKIKTYLMKSTNQDDFVENIFKDVGLLINKISIFSTNQPNSHSQENVKTKNENFDEVEIISPNDIKTENSPFYGEQPMHSNNPSSNSFDKSSSNCSTFGDSPNDIFEKFANFNKLPHEEQIKLRIMLQGMKMADEKLASELMMLIDKS